MNLLLERGANVNQIMKASDLDINTALFSAQYSIPEVTEFLLELGADPNVINGENETVLDSVETRQFIDYDNDYRREQDGIEYNCWNIQIRNILLDHGAHRAYTLTEAEKSKKLRKPKRGIYHACRHLDADTLDRLLTENHIRLPHKSYPRLIYETLETAMEFVQKDYVNNIRGYEQRLIAVLSVLQKHGCDLNEHDGDALYLAVRNGYVETTRYLLEHGADPAKCDCGYYFTNAESKIRRYYTILDKILVWRSRWTKETASAFQAIFPTPGESDNRGD